MSARILVVVPTPEIREAIVRSLRPAGYELLTFSSALEAKGTDPGPCVLVEGAAWPELHAILAETHRDRMPRILVIETEPRARSKLVDDTLLWPVKANDLQLRIEAQFRMMVQPDRVFRLTDCIVDLARQKAYRPSLSVALDDLEVRMIERFLERGEETETWPELQARYELSRTAIEEAVLHLRQKIEANPADPRHLQTVYGTGLRFVLRPPALTNLHADQTSFVGRTREITQLRMSFESGARLVSIVGPAGIGKTRLAREVGLRQAEESFPGGVWFTDLADAQHISDVVVAVAQALRVPVGDAPTIHDAVQRVADAVTTRGPTMVVLDHVDGIGFKLKGALDPLLARSTAITFVATSREPLRHAAAVAIELGSLEASDALLLAVQRRSRAGAGVPLAIELGNDEADVLVALDGAWKALGPREQRAATLSSVFDHGFSLEAFEAIVTSEDAEAILEKLSERRLVRSFHATTRRWGMSGVVKEHARRQLRAHPEGQATIDRHTVYYLALAHEFSNGITQQGGHKALKELRRERGNLQAVYARAVESDPRSALEVLLCWHEDEDDRPPVDVQLDRLDRVLEKASKIPDAQRGAGRVTRADVRIDKGMPESASEDLDYVERLPQAHRSALLDVRIRRVRARIESAQGRPESALRGYDQCVQLAVRKESEPPIVREHAAALYCQAVLHYAGRGFDAADQSLFVGQNLARSLDDGYDLARMLALSGKIASNRGDHDGAVQALGEALDLFLRFDRRLQQAEVLHDIGQSALLTDRLAEADGPLRQALYLFHQIGRRSACALTSGLLGIVRHRQLQFGEASELYEQALADLTDKALEGVFTAYAMACEADLDHLDRAEELQGRLAFQRTRDPFLGPLVEALEAHVLLAKARYAGSRGDAAGAAQKVEAVRAVRRIASEERTMSPHLVGRLYEPSFARPLLDAVIPPA